MEGPISVFSPTLVLQMQPFEHLCWCCRPNNAASVYEDYKRRKCNDKIVPSPVKEIGLEEVS